MLHKDERKNDELKKYKCEKWYKKKPFHKMRTNTVRIEITMWEKRKKREDGKAFTHR